MSQRGRDGDLLYCLRNRDSCDRDIDGVVWDVGYRGREAAKQRPAVRCGVRCVEVWRYKVHLQMRRWRPWEGMCWLDKLGGGRDCGGTRL